MKKSSSFTEMVRPEHPTLLVVGSGITGLMTAWHAHKAGYHVTVISQSPDPRLPHDNDNPQISSTFDSKNDQRYITLYEGHPYLELPGYVDAMYPGIAEDFTRTTREGGVLAVPQEAFQPETQAWLARRYAVNQRLTLKDPDTTRDVAALFDSYADENRAAMEKWHEFLTEIIIADPQLLSSLSLNHAGIIRLYDTEKALHTATASHQKDGVFKRSLTPEALAHEYPAYKTGVENGFIQGGAIEIHGLTLGVKSLARSMINLLEAQGVIFNFNKEAETILVNEHKQVTGIAIKGQAEPCRAKHYAIHPGTFATPSLFANIPEAQNQVAAMEGYWITLKGAGRIVEAMQGTPNKVHGKQSIGALLARLPEKAQARYKQLFNALDIAEEHYADIAPIVDFNNMPIYDKEGTSLGIGSGYVFKGVPYADASGKPAFTTDAASEKFTLTLMELWLEVLHGRELLDSGTLIIHPIGCKRSWTATDKELDINYATQDDGVLAIRAGGNTGDTTKSPFVSAYTVQLMQAHDAREATADPTACRAALRKTARDLSPSKWAARTQQLTHAEIIARNRIRNDSSARHLGCINF